VITCQANRANRHLFGVDVLPAAFELAILNIREPCDSAPRQPMASDLKQKMKRSRRSETSYSTEEWNVKRELITRLYFEEDKTLKEVRQLLERDYNFQPTYGHYTSGPASI